MSWLKEVEIEDLMTGDLRLVAESCGHGVAAMLLENLPKTNLYISEKPLFEAKKRYIRLKFNGSNVKDLARTLRVSEQFVYNTINSKVDTGQKDLFSAE